MPDTTVTYHSDSGRAHAAIDVKVHAAGLAMRSPEVDAAFPAEIADDLHEWAWDALAGRFWDAAHYLADQAGFPDIHQEGRSGGWLVFAAWPDDREDEVTSAFLTFYRELSAWCAEWIAAVPQKVRLLAQEMGMDRAGEEAAQRLAIAS